MINIILKGIIGLIMGLVNVLLAPIDALIVQFLPDLSSAIGSVGKMFMYVFDFMGFIIDCTGLSSDAISLVVLFFTFKLTVPLAVSTIKTGVKWYQALKP